MTPANDNALEPPLSQRFAVVWPEGQHDKAQWATSWLHCVWLQWWIGIKSWWPKPWDARRVVTFWPVKSDPFAELDADVIAYVLEQDQ